MSPEQGWPPASHPGSPSGPNLHPSPHVLLLDGGVPTGKGMGHGLCVPAGYRAEVPVHPCPLVATADTPYIYITHTQTRSPKDPVPPKVTPWVVSLPSAHPRDQSSAPSYPSLCHQRHSGPPPVTEGQGRNPINPTRTNLGREGSNHPHGLTAQQTTPLTLPIARAVSTR